jgi:hypothetical protein
VAARLRDRICYEKRCCLAQAFGAQANSIGLDATRMHVG